MLVVIYPDDYRLQALDGRWEFRRMGDDIFMHHEGYKEANIMDIPINTYSHIESGFSVLVDGKTIYTDHTVGKGYYLFVDMRGGLATAISLVQDPEWDEMTGIEERVSGL